MIVSLSCISCKENCKENLEFKNYYYLKVDEIIEYDKKTSTPGECFSDSIWLHFYETTDYLSFLTNCSFNFTTGEPPFYKSKRDLKADIKFLNNWYLENKCSMNIYKADSIVAQKRLLQK